MTNFIFYISTVINSEIESFLALDMLGKLFFLFKVYIVLVLFQYFKMCIRMLVNIHIAHTTSAFSSGATQNEKILILGDSTAYGTGASKQEDTIAGRLAHDFPKSQVINLSKNGALIKDLKNQIKSIQGQTFSMIIISCGGNDVWRLTRIQTILDDLKFVFSELENSAPKGKVIFLLYNNIASAPLFPSLVQYFLKKHSAKVQKAIQNSAAVTHVRIIELFVHDVYNPFLKNPEILFAKDGIHPSSRGYELWYNRMWRLLA